jgi:hypothetical protein
LGIAGPARHEPPDVGAIAAEEGGGALGPAVPRGVRKQPQQAIENVRMFDCLLIALLAVVPRMSCPASALDLAPEWTGGAVSAISAINWSTYSSLRSAAHPV